MTGRRLRLARKGFYLLCTSALCAEATLVTPAFSQDDQSTLTLDQITVTSRTREENLQDVPIQITALSAGDIEDAGIGSTQDFIDLVPNVTLDDSFTYLNTFVVVRGVTQINNADAPIAIVIDGVPQNNQKQFKMNLFDVERIEVLKGPQGALYGRNAIGGAINIVTRQPTNDFEGFVAGSFGKGTAIDVWGGVSGPLVEDKVLFRIAGLYKESDGLIDNAFSGADVDFIDHDYSIRGRAQIIASDVLVLDFRAMFNDFEAGAIYDTAVFSGDPNDFQEPTVNFPGETFGDIVELTFKFDWETDFATLTGITGYTNLDEAYRGDLDFSNPVDDPGGFLGFGFQAAQGQDLFVELISQELRLVSPDDQRLRWIVGGYYIHTDRKLRTRAFFDLDNTAGQIDDPALRLVDLNEDNDNAAWAIFGQAEVDITDALSAAVALRYDRDRREQMDLNSGLIREASFDSVQPKITLTYRADDDRLIYASWGTGFRSGGFNAPGIPIFADETLDTFEAGVKTRWADGRLVVNGAFFYSFVDDFQFFFVDAATASQVISNIDEVEIFGFELEFQALLAEGFEVFGALGTTDSEITASSLFPGSVGNKTPKTTDYTLNLGFQYRRELANGVAGFLRVDYEHRGNKAWQIDNDDIQKELDFVNLRVGVEGERWGLYFWGRNLTDEQFYTDFNPMQFSGLDVDLAFLGPPRSFGAEGRFRF